MPIRVLELRSVRGTGGGPEKTILLGAARANQRRVEVIVCYIRDRRDDRFRIDARAREMGVDYVEVHERHSFDPSIWTALRSIIRERRIDIVHAHEHKTDLLALLLARAEPVIPIATAHGWSGRSLRERMYYFFDRRLLVRYPLVIAVSEVIRQELVRFGGRPDRIRRLWNAIDPEHFRRHPGARPAARVRLSLPEDAVILGSVGRLEPVKRFDLLIDLLDRLRDRPRFVAVIAGEGSCRPDLEAKIATAGLIGRVRLLGHRADPREVHEAVDIYVQTSDSEGIPNALLEAMALETPIVATHVGGTAELIDDRVHGLLVPPRDVAALVRAVEETLADTASRSARVAAARTRVEHELSFDARVRSLEAIYEELVTTYGSRRRPGSGRARVST